MEKIKSYKLIALSVVLMGRLFKKSEDVTFTTESFPFDLLLAAEKRGFLEEIEEDNSEAERIENDRIEAERIKLARSEFPLDMPGREELINAEITTFDALNLVEDLTSLEGIGKAIETKILNYLEENN